MSKSVSAVKKTEDRSTVKARGRKTMVMPKQKVEFHPSAARISTFSNAVEKVDVNEMIRFNKVK